MNLAMRHVSQLKVFDAKGWALGKSYTKALRKHTLSQLHILRLGCCKGYEDKFMADLRLRTPVLRELYLDSVFFAVDAPLLRVLSVKHDVRAHQGGIFNHGTTTSVILDALWNSPLLEQLTLEGTDAFDLGDKSVSPEDRETALDLPNLRRVRLKDEMSDFGLFYIVCAAPTADLNLAIGHCVPADDFPGTFSAMGDHMRAPGYDTLIVYEEQDKHGDTHVNIRFRSSSSRRGPHGEEAEPEFALDATIAPNRELSTHDIINLLEPHINVEDIRLLDIGEIGTEDYVEVSPSEVRQTLRLFAGVTTVRLNAHHLHALRSAQDADEDDEPAVPMFQHLIVHDLTNADEFTFDDLVNAWDDIIDILQERRHNGLGCPIGMLTLTGRRKFPQDLGDFSLGLYEKRDDMYVQYAEGMGAEVVDSRGEWQGDWEYLVE
ncbi:hypothetical protein PENSPDRAFT_659595 [Peniophora sp. CONT]|nr:hypothetical protein PENSPDRAFT_659595 [Peniophora sp. CONT]